MMRPDLHELNPPIKVVYDFLITPPIPPFDRIVQLSAGDDYPEWPRLGLIPKVKVEPHFFGLGQMNVTFELRDLHAESQLRVQEINKSIHQVACVQVDFSEWVFAFNSLDVGSFLKRGDVWVVQPNIRETGPNIRQKHAWIVTMYFSDCDGEENNISRGSTVG